MVQASEFPTHYFGLYNDTYAMSLCAIGKVVVHDLASTNGTTQFDLYTKLCHCNPVGSLLKCFFKPDAPTREMPCSLPWRNVSECEKNMILIISDKKVYAHTRDSIENHCIQIIWD